MPSTEKTLIDGVAAVLANALASYRPNVSAKYVQDIRSKELGADRLHAFVSPGVRVVVAADRNARELRHTLSVVLMRRLPVGDARDEAYDECLLAAEAAEAALSSAETPALVEFGNGDSGREVIDIEAAQEQRVFATVLQPTYAEYASNG